MSEEQNGAAQETPNAAPDEQQVNDAKVAEKLFDNKDSAPPPAEEKPVVEPEKKEEVAPEKVEEKKPEELKLVLPENALIDQSRLDAIAEFAKEKQLSQEVAQEIVNRESEAISNYLKAQAETFETQVEDWRVQCEKDKEIGGQDFAKNCELAKRAVDKFVSMELKNMLAETGWGNNPEVLRAFMKIGKAMDNDKLVLSGAQSAGKRSVAELLYPENSN